ncbi:hypothetical protein INR49_015559 [Caranx melampygus]|nr:hypothetical protein INR49_015559 [Caranx melampygus]
MLGTDRLYSFDHAFGPTASQDEVYESCVQPMVESLLDGCNATVFCYGQTGSGKTYTLRGGNLGFSDEEGGIIDRLAQGVFALLGEKMKNSDGVEATVRVSYMELYKEELRDLLELKTSHKDLHIREDEKGNTVVVGAKEVVVNSAEELLSVLEMGNALRCTSTTGMNEHSSRSHAILTLQLIQCCSNNNASLKSVCSSKLCLVDLAGSERARKTGNTGIRLKESVHINTGLLALGNVIRALSDPARTRRGNNSNSAHIPYRAAKLTRLLRDSLGGTAHTLMVACVSPSHHSVTETLCVLQFASKARHIRNRPGAISALPELRSCPSAWDPSEARLGELEYEIKTLRERLKEKEKEMELHRERTGGGAAEMETFKQLRTIEPDQKINQEQSLHYCLLAQEAAVLLADISGSPSQCFRPQLQDWQERLTALNNAHQINDKDCSEGNGDQPGHFTILKLREDLNQCQEALKIEKQLLEQKDAELRQVQKDVEKLLQESKTHLKALDEEKEHNRIQTEKLLDQQILIDRLHSDLVTFRGATSGAALEAAASGDSDRRPHSVPLIRQSGGHIASRKIHSSPPAYSLERVMAAFKMRGHLLLAKLEEKDEVYCPSIKQQAESKDRGQEKVDDDDHSVTKLAFRRSLNRTWTNREKKSALKEKNTGIDQTSNGHPLVQRPQGTSGTNENYAKQRNMMKARLRASITQRRIQDLAVNMRMEEELITELDKTDKKIQAVDRNEHHRDDADTGVLARLAMQNQEVRAEMYRSLQLRRLQRAQLQTSLRQLRQTADDDNKELCQSGALSQGLLRVSMQLESVEENLQSSGTGRRTGGITKEELEKERDMLQKRRDALEAQLKENRALSIEESHALLQMEEAIEALDAALEFKDCFIQKKQKKLDITDSSSPQSTEPAHVVHLREAECHLRMRCEELQLQAQEQEGVMREMEAAMQRLALDADRRLTQQSRDHQNNIQLLLQELQESGSGESQQAIQDRLQHLEKELFFYKSCSRQLKKKLKDLSSGPLHSDNQPLNRQEHKQTHNMQVHASSNKSWVQTEEVPARARIATTYTKIHAEQTDQKIHFDFHRRHAHQSPCPSSSCGPQTHRETKPEYIQMLTQTQSLERSEGDNGESLEMTPVRLCRKELKEICPAALQVSGSATRRRQSLLDTSTESILEDSIEVARNNDR